MASIGLWIVAWILIAVRSRTNRHARVAPVIALAVAPAPWLLTGATLFPRIGLAFAVTFLFLSAVDFAAGRRPATLAGRLRYPIALFALIDPMTAVPVRQHFSWAATRRIMAAACIAAMAAGIWAGSGPLPSVARITVRLVAAAATILVLAELNTGIVGMVSAVCGVRFAPVHSEPFRSRTVAEFWARRWNHVGARWFREHVFLRMRARGVPLALFALFGVSAAIHAYLIAPVAPIKCIVMFAAFFAAQPLLLLAERQLGVARWPAAAARAWTMLVLLALLPLILAPALAALRLTL